MASSGRSVRSWSWTISSSTFTRRFLDSSVGSRGCGWCVSGGPRAATGARSIARRSRARSGPVGPASCRSRLVALRASSSSSRAPRASGAPSSRSGRRSASVAAPRAAPAATAPWSPEVRMAGTSMPRNLGGRVYCGYSSRPAANDSSAVEAASIAPGQQADDGVDDDERRQLAAGQDVVADRELEVDERADPLVDALVARADEDEVRRRRRGRAARAWRKTSPAGSSEDDRSSRSRRSSSSAAATGSGRRTIPAPPPYGVSSTVRWRPRPQRRRSWTRIVGEPALLDPGRDALRERTLEHRREQRQDVDLEGHRPLLRRVRRVARSPVARRRPVLRSRRPPPLPRRPSSGACGRTRPAPAAAGGRAPPRRRRSRRGAGAKIRMNVRTAGNVELAVRIAPHDDRPRSRPTR